MHFFPSCSVSFYTSFPLSLTLSQRDFGPRAEPPRQRFLPVYCLQQLSSTNEMLQVKHGWGLVPWLRLKSKPGKERSVQCLRWRSVWLSSGQKTPPPSYLLHTFPPSSSPSSSSLAPPTDSVFGSWAWLPAWFLPGVCWRLRPSLCSVLVWSGFSSPRPRLLRNKIRYEEFLLR